MRGDGVGDEVVTEYFLEMLASPRAVAFRQPDQADGIMRKTQARPALAGPFEKLRLGQQSDQVLVRGPAEGGSRLDEIRGLLPLPEQHEDLERVLTHIHLARLTSARGHQ